MDGRQEHSERVTIGVVPTSTWLGDFTGIPQFHVHFMEKLETSETVPAAVFTYNINTKPD